MSHESFVSVVAPIHDPGPYLESFVEVVGQILARDYRYYEIILVDDGSVALDPSRVRALLDRQPNVRLLHLSREFGEEQAILAGLDVALGDYVVTLSPGADPPELIPAFLDAARSGADVVLGVRTSRERDAWWLRLGAWVFYGYVKRVLHLDIPENATHFRCLSRRGVHALAQLRRGSMRLRVFTTYLGISPRLIAYDQVGSTDISHSRSPVAALGTAMAIIMDNSPHPLRLVAGIGLIASSLNLLYALYVILVYLLRREVAPGWATLSLTSAAQFFALTLMTAVLCEYVGRLSTRLHDAPSFYVRGEETSTVMLALDRRNVVADAVVPEIVPGRPLPGHDGA